MIKVDILAYDLDGTLSHSLPDIAGSMNMALKKEGYPAVDESKIRSFVGDGVAMLVERTLSYSLSGEADFCLDPAMTRRFTEQYRTLYADHCTDQSQLYGGVMETLKYFQNKIQVVITNKPLIMTQKMLEHFRIRNYFDFVVCGDTLPVRKPDRAVVEYILSRTGGSRPMVLIGDSTVDIQTARNAGIYSIAVDYGYSDKDKLVTAKPDYLISSLLDLNQIIE